MFRHHVAWLQDDPRTTLKLLDEIASTAERLPEAQRREVRKRLWPLYALLAGFTRPSAIVDGMHLGDSRMSPRTSRTKSSSPATCTRMAMPGGCVNGSPRWRQPLPDNLPPFLAARMTYSNRNRPLGRGRARSEVV
jgi:hypothetical protein